MKKSYLFLASAAMILAGCANDDYLGDSRGTQGNGAIEFSTKRMQTTRATSVGQSAAEKLNRQFFVYGYKNASAEAETKAGDELVFPNYRVIYDENTAYTTESNTHNWEYVGDWSNYGSTITGNQSIKYWDYSAQSYTFHAFSLLPQDIETGNVTATKIEEDATDVYGKGWTFTIKDAASLADIYVANREVVSTKNTSPSHEPNYVPEDANKIGNYVNLTFRALASKIRFALYETVPGYEVHINKLYYSNTAEWNSNSETNFALDMEYLKAKSAGTAVTVTYGKNGTPEENQPITSVADGAADKPTYGIFGTNVQATPAIGVTSNGATYDYAAKDYTTILPYTSTKDMKLMVDYTLTSTDGSGETIEVKHATAIVPKAYADWKPNFAYTYIFKISNNTNGTTGNPDDPTPDPAGLYPITFDACVVDVITDVQETITTVANPSITTYANGVIVTENDEYTPGSKVCVTVDAGTTLTANTNCKLFEVYNHGTESITEETVANYANNYMTLIDVTSTGAVAANISAANGSTITISNYAFTAVEGKTYAFRYEYEAGKYAYKVIKVTGDRVAEPALTLARTAVNTATDKSTTVTFTVKASDKNVLGVRNLLTGADKLDVVDNGNGTYTAKFKDAVISEGTANTAQTISYTGATGTVEVVGLTYAIDPATPVALVAGGNQTISLKIGSDVITNVVITNSNEGLTVEEQETADVKNGTIKVSAANNIVGGNKTITISGVNYTIPVTSYVVGITPTTITNVNNASTEISFTLKDNSDAAITGKAANFKVTKNNVVVVAPGITEESAPNEGTYKFSVTEGGKYKVSYLGYSDEVTVNMYTLAYAGSYSNAIAQTTGSTQLNLKLNGAVTLPTAAKVTIVKTSGSTDATSNFVIGTNGKNITIAAKSTADKTDYTVRYEISTGVYATASLTVE